MSMKKSDKKLLKELIDKGYGEAERKKRREILNKKTKSQLKARQTKADNEADKDTAALKSAAFPENSSANEETANSKGEAWGVYRLLDPKVRRRIDSFAFKSGCKVVGGKETIISLLTIFNPYMKDYVSNDFLKLLLWGKGYKEANPYHYCLFDNLDALFFASRFLLGYDRLAHGTDEKKAAEERVKQIEEHLKNKAPLILTFLKRFIDRDKILYNSLLNLATRFKKRRDLKIEVIQLSEIVKGFYRLYLIAGQVEEHNLEKVLVLVKEICRAYDTDSANFKQIDASLFRFEVAFNNLKEFKHEIFPLLLKILGVFFPENELRDKDKLQKLLAFLNINEGEIITFHQYLEKLGGTSWPPEDTGDSAKVQTPEEAAQADDDLDEDDSEQVEGAENTSLPFEQQFSKLLQILKVIFPGSGIEELGQWGYISPYFEMNIFSKDPALLEHLKNIAKHDPVGQIMVIHRILDNMFTSIKINILDEILHKGGRLKDELYGLLSKWTEVYTDLFIPYLKILNEYKTLKEFRGRITLSNKLKLEKNAEQLRILMKYMIKMDGNEPASTQNKMLSVKLFELVHTLNRLMQDLDRSINKDLIQKNEPRAINTLKELAKQGVVDFNTHSYKPAIKRIKDVLEAQYKTNNLNNSMKAQFTFFEILLLLLKMYDFLLNNSASIYKSAGETIQLAGAEEERLWNRMRKDLDGRS
jgi:hypothetical protein